MCCGLGYACVAIPLPVICCHLHDKAFIQDSVFQFPPFLFLFFFFNVFRKLTSFSI